jgi:hypothetical protein
MATKVSHAAPIQRLALDLVLHVRKPGSIRILPLETPATGVPSIAGGVVFAMPIFHEILAVTVGTLDLNILIQLFTPFYNLSPLLLVSSSSFFCGTPTFYVLSVNISINGFMT